MSYLSHFESDAVKFLTPYAPQWYSVRDGTVTIHHKEEVFPDVDHYFKSMRFLEFVLTQPLKVEPSKDASMAWVIGEVRARAIQKQPDTTEKEVAFRCSWVEIYEKQDARWAAVVNASSFVFPNEGE